MKNHVRIYLAALAASAPLALAGNLQEPAKLSPIQTTHPVPLPQFIATLTPLADRDTANGIRIAIFTVQDTLGECDNSGGGPVGINARTCPRQSIIISTTREQGGGSQFRLYKTSSRLVWTMPNTTLPKTVIPTPYRGILLACEASTEVDQGRRDGDAQDHWHYVEYQLEIQDFDKVALRRLPDTGQYSACPIIKPTTGRD